MKLLFLLPALGHPRHERRIRALERLGVEASTLAFARRQYGAADLPDLQLLPKVENARYAKRVWSLLRAVPTVRRKARSADVLYAFSLDTALLALIAMAGRPIPLAYEVGDIREAFLDPGSRGGLLRALERRVLSRTDVLVATSPSYLSEYYEAQLKPLDQPPSQLVVENKIDPADNLPPAVSEKRSSGFRIGYFGVVRCTRSIEVLERLGGEGARGIEVYLRGVERRGVDLEKVTQHPHISYDGPYLVPDDLGRMYGGIDLAWIALHHAKANLRWSRVNRFYEACYYGVPMIAQEGTLDGEVVAAHDLGLVIDLLHPERAVERIRSISSRDLSRWKWNLEQLPRSVYEHAGEHDELLRLLAGRPA